MIDRRRLRRWHIWLGWIVAIPMLLWTVSGVVMVWKPIEEVRGTALIKNEPSIGGPVGVKLPEELEHFDIASLSLENRATGARWVMVLAGDGGTLSFDPRTGKLLPAPSAADAAAEVAMRYTGKARIVSTTRIDPGGGPLEYRRFNPAWLVAMSDGTHFYVDATNGDIVARRTGWWRFYDFMWGLHIMDPAGREDTHNPWVITFALVSLATVILALFLLPMTINRRTKA